MITRRRSSGRGKAGAVFGMVLVLAVLSMHSQAGAQGLTFRKGQTVSPVYEGWEKNQDGSYTLWFGYINRNWEETPDVSVGPDNQFSPGTPDRGQPSHFLPRLNRFVFSIEVPASYAEGEELVWTIRTQGQTESVYATLHRDYFLDMMAIMNQRGALGGGSYPAEWANNTPPVTEVRGEAVRHARVGEPVTLLARVTDDGLPYPDSARTLPVGEDGRLDLKRALRKPTSHVLQKVRGLTFSWFVYRGEGAAVSFDPEQVKVWRDTRPYASRYSELGVMPEIPDDNVWVTRATFSKPGTYVLRGRADDGGLFTDTDLTIHVAP